MYQFVSVHTAALARLNEQLPEIPDDIGDSLHPIKNLNGTAGMEFYRQGGVWMFRNRGCVWMPTVWSHGDPAFQDRLTLSYADPAASAASKNT